MATTQNSPTTRILGATYLASMQMLSVHAVMERVLTMSNGRANRGKALLRRVCMLVPGLPLIAGWLLRLSIPPLISIVLGMEDTLYQCSGVNAGINFGSFEGNFCVL